ncbi:MAG: sensor histidine kinase [Thermodesulfobacteriales bacterium]|nr:MAG: sensor histidine kinase [Thermodesulfobacteriales bacterium]
MNLSKQITFGYALMFLLMLLISGFSVYSIYNLDKAAENIKGRHTTLSNLISDKKEANEGFFANEMLLEAVKISDDQIKYSYITVFTVIGVILVFGIILTFFIPRVITKPIFNLFKAAESVAGGDYSYRVDGVKSSGEIDTLVQAFNHMIDNIEISNRELQKKNDEILKLLETTKRFNDVLETEIEEATREIKEKHKALIKTEKLATIGELATGVAHEVRNPLSGIAIALELMQAETENEEHKQTISEILNEIVRLERIVKGLFQLGHPKSLQLIECEPNDIVERALSLVNMRAKSKGVTIEKQLGCGNQFNVDHEQIEQVLLNLLINGIDATGSFGTVKVETKNCNGTVEIAVSDTGCGFSEKDIDKILQPFYSTKERGTGLGLAISNGIVEAHGGKMHISSKKGSGSRFVVEIPNNLNDDSIA